VFAGHGIVLTPGDPNRRLKIRQFHSRLRVPKDRAEPPMLQVYSTCEAFIRTIPTLQADPNNPEDVYTRMEDHCYDEACLAVMARPMGAVARASKAGNWGV